MSDVPDSSIDNRDGSEQDSSRQSDLRSNPSDRNNVNIDDENGPGGGIAGNAAGAVGNQQRRAAPQDGGVPQYVDMVIPQYESSSGEQGQRQRQNSSGRRRLENAETSSDSNGDTGQDSGTSHENDSADNDQQSEDSDELRMGERISNPAEADVLLTEGDEHPGNKKYQAVVKHLAKKYTAVKSGYRKAAVEILVNAVKVQGGRFLKKDENGNWRQVSMKNAYEKSARAIRRSCRKLEVEPNVSSQEYPDGIRQDDQASPYQSESRSESQDDNNNNLETIALRLQTKDQKLDHLALDLQTVDHDYLFTLAKALDSNDVLRSLEINLSSLSRTNANALAWGIKKCETLEQVKLSFAELSEKRSSIVLSGILENPHVISLNLCENDIDAPTCAAICNMIKNCKTTALQRLSLENNPFGDEGAKAVAEMIVANNTIRYLNLGNNMLTETGANILQIVAKGKTSCLFEISGLPTSFKRKRDVTSSEDSEDTPPNPAKVAKKDPNGILIGPSVQGAVSSMTTSDNGARSNSASGSDEGRNPTSMSSMTGSDNGYAPASSGSDGGRTCSGYAAAASSTTGSDEGRNSSLNDSDSNQGSNSAKKTTHFFEMAALSDGGGKLKSEEPPSSEDSEDTPRKKRKGISGKARSSLTFRNVKDFDDKQEAEEKAEERAKEESRKKSDALVAANRKGSNF